MKAAVSRVRYAVRQSHLTSRNCQSGKLASYEEPNMADPTDSPVMGTGEGMLLLSGCVRSRVRCQSDDRRYRELKFPNWMPSLPDRTPSP
jgi:hypothetical protein